MKLKALGGRCLAKKKQFSSSFYSFSLNLFHCRQERPKLLSGGHSAIRCDYSGYSNCFMWLSDRLPTEYPSVRRYSLRGHSLCWTRSAVNTQIKSSNWWPLVTCSVYWPSNLVDFRIIRCTLCIAQQLAQYPSQKFDDWSSLTLDWYQCRSQTH